MFDDVAQKFEGCLLYSNTYNISNGIVQKTNPAFPNIHPEIELVLQNYTIVDKVEENSKWENIPYEFVPFKEVAEKSNNNKSLGMAIPNLIYFPNHALDNLAPKLTILKLY